MARIFLSHTPDMLKHYYGARALAALRELGDVALNETGAVLDDPLVLAKLVQGSRILVADRQTPVPAAFFASICDLQAVCRVAVDIRNIDVEAASRHGVLVTRATPGFIDSVCELAVGFMVDLGRGISDSVRLYRAGQASPARRSCAAKAAAFARCASTTSVITSGSGPSSRIDPASTTGISLR